MDDIFRYEKRKKEIGARIKALRKQQDLSQDGLADRLFQIAPTKDKAIGQSTVSSWERGVTLPPLERLIALASIFECDLSYLLCDYDKKRKDVWDICCMTGLSEKAISRVLIYKEQYPGYVDSLNFLLESDNFDDVLYRIYDYSDALRRLDSLQKLRNRQIISFATSKDYTPNLALLDEIRVRTDAVDLCEYNLSTRFGYIIQELKRTVESEINETGRCNDG